MKIRVLILFYCCICTVQSQRQLGVAIGNGNIGGGGDVVRREHYEYNAPGAQRHRRRGGPFDGIIPGVILTIASSTLQWWNEGRAVRLAKMLGDAKKQVVELDSTAPVNPENDGKLVHVTGDIMTKGGVVDPVHGLYRPDALQLVRSTEAYQWKEQRSETKTRVSETKTKVEVKFRYYKGWTKKSVESNRFESSTGHFNPYPKYQLGIDKITVNDARISNGLRIPPDLVDQIGNQDITIFTTSKYPRLRESHDPSSVAIGRGGDLPYIDGAVISSNTLYFSENKISSDVLTLGDDGRPVSQLNKIPSNNRIDVTRSIPMPEVGDVRVSWKEIAAPSDGVSILAQQQGDKLVPWAHSDTGHNIFRLIPGKFSARLMLEELIGKNKVITKFLRIGGWMGSFIGMNLVLSCIPALAKIVPFGIGNLLAPLAQIATSTIALSIATGLSAAVIAVAWLRFRPLLATSLAFVSGAGFFGPFFYARWKRSPVVKEVDTKLYTKEL
mmetsp:Transcript_7972/g.17982  ORF Transcript_7972/g.17982 Transcript_7972/m.17982 type:complete len:498 (-) Transcript_7972:29-1522(-)